MDSSQLYLSQIGAIERVIGSVCRRHHLAAGDAEDFASVARLHLIVDDYAVLKKFEGRSSIHTYLAVVITRQFQDWRNARWGKWRASAEARRLGPVAVHLERLVVRDHLSLDEAHETLRTNFDITESRQTLESMAARLPQRAGRTFVSDEALEHRPAPDVASDISLLQREAAAEAQASATALRSAIAKLAPQDRLILRMRYEDDLSIADIARTLHIDQKPLYRRVEKLLAEVRTLVEAAGLTAAAASQLLDAGGFDLVHQTGGETPADVRPFPGSGHSPVQNVRAE